MASSASPDGVGAGTFIGTTVQELQQWLAFNGIDVSCYGQGTARTVAELLEESKNQECTLTARDSAALRTVQVLSLLVTNSRQQVLYEDRQVLPDGRVRVRDLPLSEKLVGSELWRDAVTRAVREELGSILPAADQGRVQVLDATYQRSEEVSASMSYPGLRTKYIFHRVRALVPGLPETPFVTYEPRPGGQLQSHWVWRTLSDPATLPTGSIEDTSAPPPGGSQA